MKVGFDLDKIFIDYPPFIPDSFIDKLYKKKANGVLLYRFPSKPEQLLRKLSHFPLFRPLIQENLQVLKATKKANHTIYLISSRFSFLKHETTKMMQRNKLNLFFTKTFFNFTDKQPHLFKNEIIKDLKLDMYIDDDFHLLRFVASHNPKTQFYWLNTRKKGKIAANITAITKLSDILPQIHSYARS